MDHLLIGLAQLAVTLLLAVVAWYALRGYAGYVLGLLGLGRPPQRTDAEVERGLRRRRGQAPRQARYSAEQAAALVRRRPGR